MEVQVLRLVIWVLKNVNKFIRYANGKLIEANFELDCERMTMRIMKAVVTAAVDGTSMDTSGMPKWAEDCAYKLLRDARNPELALGVLARRYEVFDLVKKNMTAVDE